MARTRLRRRHRAASRDHATRHVSHRYSHHRPHAHSSSASRGVPPPHGPRTGVKATQASQRSCPPYAQRVPPPQATRHEPSSGPRPPPSPSVIFCAFRARSGFVVPGPILTCLSRTKETRRFHASLSQERVQRRCLGATCGMSRLGSRMLMACCLWDLVYKARLCVRASHYARNRCIAREGNEQIQGCGQ